LGKAERIGGRKPRERERLRDKGENGRRFGQNSSIRYERRNATLRIDCKIFWRPLLRNAEVNTPEHVGHVGVLERDMRGKRACLGSVIEGKHSIALKVVSISPHLALSFQSLLFDRCYRRHECLPEP